VIKAQDRHLRDMVAGGDDAHSPGPITSVDESAVA
jgi:hypothetical protein